MNIKITKKQNVVVDGVKYVTDRVDGYRCTHCAFDMAMHMVCEVAPCGTGERRDGRSIIFIKKVPKAAP